MAKGLLREQLCSLISYYAPNKGQATFFMELFRILTPLLEDTVICGSDSNIALDLSLDKSNPTKAQLCRTSCVRWNAAKFYIHRDKTGTMLAHKLSPRFRMSTVPKVRGETLSQNPQKVLDAC